MADRFFDALGKQLFVWSGWVFTVGGAIGSFVLGQGYAWIGWLAVSTGLLALTGHAFSLHRRVRQLDTDNHTLTEQLRESDRRLAEVSQDTVQRIERIVAAYGLLDWSTRLAAHGDYVLRMRRFSETLTRRVELRTFVPRAGALFAIATVPAEALATIQADDFFLLIRDADGLRTEVAFLVVNQPPIPADEVVHFRVVQLLSDELRHLEGLASSTGGVRGLTGYTIRPTCDPDWYAGLESDTIQTAITRLAQGLERDRRRSP